ncbi:succinyl-diaminopimelate desuccinylase [Nocardioides sp.]|uniref:succinyl-diaminopimelate desuccinylase n=1 Tax=Nocardioides sp. TaxID=35761 RepID=UPI002D1E030F|nr:succinyl-diaminopimelate desuccinylase [Nocardioides sp.]HSX67063.1 succinyl-diaminopimelate desuccinylase [Nocardioides sp.]
MSLDLTADVVELTRQLVDFPSESLQEAALADAVEVALREHSHLEVTRVGNTVVARTVLGRPERVVIAGHLDTVPENGNLPSRLEGGVLHGLGSVDMKGGVAVGLKLAAGLTASNRDITYVFYDAEEIAAIHNGLGKISQTHPHLLEADFAILMEPSNALVEAGCQGTMRVEVATSGERAHTARAWMGSNAIHKTAELLNRLNAYEPRKPVIDGLTYHEGLNAVFINGGVAGNVLPDACTVTVNYRFAPDRSEAEAEAFLHDFFDGYSVTVTDSSPGALPGLTRPAARAFLDAVGGAPAPKFGWTDVSRFSALGVPAVNFGPGDPLLAHKAEEHVHVEEIVRCEQQLVAWLSETEGESR